MGETGLDLGQALALNWGCGCFAASHSLGCMSRGRTRSSDLAKLWVFEIVVIAGAIYAGAQQSNAALCDQSSTTPPQSLFECFTGSLSHTLFPWLILGAVVLGVLTVIATLIFALRRR